jgi:hypothetical protein
MYKSTADLTQLVGLNFKRVTQNDHHVLFKKFSKDQERKNSNVIHLNKNIPNKIFRPKVQKQNKQLQIAFYKGINNLTSY